MAKNTEQYTTVVVQGDTYTIRKFTARDGLKIARLILAKLAPIIPMIAPDEDNKKGKARKSASSGDGFSFAMLGKALDSMSDEDIDYLIDKCLRVCYKQLPAGPQPVIDENGYYGVEGVEYDFPLTISLCIEAIKWGAGDFFGENGLDLNHLSTLIGK